MTCEHESAPTTEFHEWVGGWHYIATCPDCYDGATDAGPQRIGNGATAKEAVLALQINILIEENTELTKQLERFGVQA